MPQRGGALRRARELLIRADYTSAGLTASGLDVGLGVRSGDVPSLVPAVRAVEPLATLVRLFLFGQPVAVAELERRLGRADTAVLGEAGLLARQRGQVRATVSLTPWRGGIVAHDPDPAGDLWAGHVAGPNPAADTLANLVVPAPAEVALDLGTGSGVLALAVAGQAGRVVATDINPHALRLAATTAALSGADSVETRQGSLFEPVEAEEFGLIVANPPFVIAPETGHLFRQSSMPRDEVARSVVAGVAAHLAEGGVAHVLANWIQAPGESWADVPTGWVAGTGCDALLIAHGVEDPLAYAVRWNAREQQVAPQRYPETLERWLSYYRRERIEAIGSGAIILRRRSGANWVHAVEPVPGTSSPAGAHVAAILRGRDYLADSATDDDIATGRFRVTGPHRILQALISTADGYVLQPSSLVLDQGLALAGRVEPDLLPVVVGLDGERPLGAIVHDVATATAADASTMTVRAVALMRELLLAGLIEPTGAPT